MTTIVIKLKSKKEEEFFRELLKKMNIETHLIEEPVPNYETQKVIEDVETGKGIHVKDSGELFAQLGI
jgi:hypothetical protein